MPRAHIRLAIKEGHRAQVPVGAFAEALGAELTQHGVEFMVSHRLHRHTHEAFLQSCVVCLIEGRELARGALHVPLGAQHRVHSAVAGVLSGADDVDDCRAPPHGHLYALRREVRALEHVVVMVVVGLPRAIALAPPLHQPPRGSILQGERVDARLGRLCVLECRELLDGQRPGLELHRDPPRLVRALVHLHERACRRCPVHCPLVVHRHAVRGIGGRRLVEPELEFRGHVLGVRAHRAVAPLEEPRPPQDCTLRAHIVVVLQPLGEDRGIAPGPELDAIPAPGVRVLELRVFELPKRLPALAPQVEPVRPLPVRSRRHAGGFPADPEPHARPRFRFPCAQRAAASRRRPTPRHRLRPATRSLRSPRSGHIALSSR